jgi:hypothetical protein
MLRKEIRYVDGFEKLKQRKMKELMMGGVSPRNFRFFKTISIIFLEIFREIVTNHENIHTK